MKGKAIFFNISTDCFLNTILYIVNIYCIVGFVAPFFFIRYI